jgi:ABC-type transport system substrate-binding protein
MKYLKRSGYALNRKFSLIMLIGWALSQCGCNISQLNNPYSSAPNGETIIYSSFAERPKHLDPAISYSSDEYGFICQIYEPPLQYHYLKRPYQLQALTAVQLPQVRYLDKQGQPLPEPVRQQDIVYSEYIIDIKPGIRYQPHPAFSKNNDGDFLYHNLSDAQLDGIHILSDFKIQQSRELRAEDYVYQIKRLAYPKIHSSIAELMAGYIDGFAEFSRQTAAVDNIRELKNIPLTGVRALSDYRYSVRIKGEYPQFQYWLAMPFFAPMPWEADAFYAQPGLKNKNISLDWFPIGTGPYFLEENNPNRRMVLTRNPNFHAEYYPDNGEPEDQAEGLLADASKQLPFVDKVVYTLEKETIPYWAKFLQGYYDGSGINSDSFDQAIQFSGTGDPQLTAAMRDKHIQLQTSVTSSVFYMGFNMLDNVVGGESEQARKLRQAISIAVDYEEFIAIFANGRGVAAQGILPPGIFGYQDGAAGVNPVAYEWKNSKPQRKTIAAAKQLMVEAGYANGIDPQSGEALLLYFDTTVGANDQPLMNWYRKQFAKLGIQLVVRATDYNRFQEKIRTGAAQIFVWGWNADYPDPENFFFLLYGPNSKVKNGGENAGNYINPEFDRLFEQMRNMENTPERQSLIDQMQAIVQRDAPWLFGYYPKDFTLYHAWYKNLKPARLINNRLKYVRIDQALREAEREKWNQPIFWPLLLLLLLLAAAVYPAIHAYRRRLREIQL